MFYRRTYLAPCAATLANAASCAQTFQHAGQRVTPEKDFKLFFKMLAGDHDATLAQDIFFSDPSVLCTNFPKILYTGFYISVRIF
jgi:hypothetical protein